MILVSNNSCRSLCVEHKEVSKPMSTRSAVLRFSLLLKNIFFDMAAENQCRNSEKKINAFSVTSRQSTGLRNPRLVKKKFTR